MKKRIAALALAGVMMLSTALPVFASQVVGPRNIIGEGGVHTPTVEVVIPTHLNFNLDPFAISGGADQVSQVVEATFDMINNTIDTPVSALFFLDVEVEDDVTLTATTPTNNLSFTNRNKEIRFGIVPATTIDEADETELEDAAFAADTVALFAGALANAVWFDADDENAAIGFVMDAATPLIPEVPADPGPAAPEVPAALAAGGRGLASFMFAAEMTAFGDWQAGDVNVSGVLWLTPVHTDMVYTGGVLVASARINGWNRVPQTQIDAIDPVPGVPPAPVADDYIGLVAMPAGFTAGAGNNFTVNMNNADLVAASATSITTPIIVPIATHGTTTVTATFGPGGAALTAADISVVNRRVVLSGPTIGWLRTGGTLPMTVNFTVTNVEGSNTETETFVMTIAR